MADLHIDDFYRDCAMIFLRLYATFPRKTVLYVDDICGPDTPDEFGLHSERHQACFSAMTWMAEADYLSFTESIREEALDQAVLTQRGFLLLSSRSELELGIPEDEIEGDLPPSVMERSLTNVTQVRHALREGSSIIIQQVMHYLLDK
ncbi:MAG: hypothetical protein V2I66_00275 [Halieaceae bacterium]|jgi:hypothetical protein|nr:hypothetical protein [Halieaceae bacterium]